MTVKDFLKGETLLRYYSEKRKNKRYDINEKIVIKVNLGCGLKVCSNYFNLDYNLPCLFAEQNTLVLSLLYYYLKLVRYSELNRPHRFSITRKQFVHIIKNQKFIFHSILYGIPFNNNTVDYYYSSHMLGFSFPQNISYKIFQEIYRTLKLNGLIRLSLTDGDYYWLQNKRIKKSERNNTNENCFTFNEIESILKEIGFSEIRKYKFQEGKYPDMKELDDYSPEVDKAIQSKTMYVEAQKK